MKNLNNYNVKKLSKTEINSTFGGGWFKSFGKSVGEAWCSIKGVASEIWVHSDKIVHPGSTFH
jgi:hypothetical protein